MDERGAAGMRGSVATGVGEGAAAVTPFGLLPSYANSWFLLAVFFFGSAFPAFCGVWISCVAGPVKVGLPPRTPDLDFGLWALDSRSGLSDATSTSKMSPKMPLTNA